jgi:hypothetical protein
METEELKDAAREMLAKIPVESKREICCLKPLYMSMRDYQVFRYEIINGGGK